MTDPERGQVGAAAAAVYEAFFVPALFGQFAERVLDHAGVSADDRVLDVGCGTGVVARAARDRVGKRGSVVAIDPNRAMLEVARRAEPRVDWREATAESIPADDEAFDHTVSQFAAMFFTDRLQAIEEMARVTAVGGSVTVATWSDLDRTPGYSAMVALVADEIGDVAADALRAPFVLGTPDHLRSVMEPMHAAIRVDEARRHGSVPVHRRLGSHRRPRLDARRLGRRRGRTSARRTCRAGAPRLRDRQRVGRVRGTRPRRYCDGRALSRFTRRARGGGARDRGGRPVRLAGRRS